MGSDGKGAFYPRQPRTPDLPLAFGSEALGDPELNCTFDGNMNFMWPIQLVLETA